MHGRSHGIMTGSGTSALVLALWALGLHGKRVAVPNGVCYSVPLAVILSGNEPVYLDIDRETLSLGVAQLRK
jgi:dTDP-4-amino-4,6-dideoxygalactose transaminase